LTKKWIAESARHLQRDNERSGSIIIRAGRTDIAKHAICAFEKIVYRFHHALQIYKINRLIGQHYRYAVFSLRVCPGTSSGIAKLSEHEAD